MKEFGLKCRKILRKSRPPSSNISNAEHASIKSLRNDKNIEILPADKGTATVILSRDSYVEKMKTVLDDPVHFKPIDSNPIVKWEKLLQHFLLENLCKPGLISQRLYRFLRPSDARMPQLYGLPKIHKPSVPLRPIVSATRSFNFNVGKFLVWLFSKYMTDCPSYVKNSIDFVNSLSSVKPGYSRQVSFDVKSLFTNVPVQEATDLALEKYINDENCLFRIPSDRLRKLLDFATKYCCFNFNDTLYLQVDGLSMGNPLAPPLSQFFMISIGETRALNIGFRFYTWWRYVDDVYARMNKKDFENLPEILKRLNSLHPAIEFTSESEKRGNLNFLQVSVTKDTGNHSNYRTTVYRKPTHTNLYTKWKSAHPPTQKLGIFHSLLWTAKRICKSKKDYSEESNTNERKTGAYLGFWASVG